MECADSILCDHHAASQRLQVHGTPRRRSSHNTSFQDIWIVVNYEKKNNRHRREARQQFLPDSDRTCGLRKVEVDLDDWYPNLKDVVHAPKTFTFTFCEGRFT